MKIGGAEEHKDDFTQDAWLLHAVHGGREGNASGVLDGISIDTSGNSGEGDARDSMRLGERQAVAISGGQQVGFPRLAAAPDRTDRVDDETGGKLPGSVATASPCSTPPPGG